MIQIGWNQDFMDLTVLFKFSPMAQSESERMIQKKQSTLESYFLTRGELI